MSENYKAIIFDCDGTLLNTIADLSNAVNYALRTLKIRELSCDEIVKLVGRGIRYLVDSSLPEEHKYLSSKAFELFKDYYAKHFADHTLPYAGIIEVLAELKKRGYKTAIVSNKKQEYLNLLCDKFFSKYIDFKIGETVGLCSKPSADMVEYAVNMLCVEKDEAVYIGDSTVDIETAKNASIDGIFCSWGFSNEKDLISNGARMLIHTPFEILDLV